MSEPITRFVVGKREGGKRLDHFLHERIPGLSRNRIQQAVRERVTLSWGVRARPATHVQPGGVVRIGWTPLAETRLELDLPVLRRGPGWMAVDKPSGIPVHPVNKVRENSLIRILRRQGVLGCIRFASWLCMRPRHYVRVASSARRLVPFRMAGDHTDQGRPVPPDIRRETARLILRPMGASDLDSVASLLPHDASWRDELSLASELLQGWLTLVALRRDDEETIGTFALTPFEIDGQLEYELGYRVRFDQFGKGFATEGAMALRDISFGQLALDRLISIVSPSNAGSIRVAERNEMHFEREWRLAKDPVHIYGMSVSDVRGRDVRGRS